VNFCNGTLSYAYSRYDQCKFGQDSYNDEITSCSQVLPAMVGDVHIEAVISS